MGFGGGGGGGALPAHVHNAVPLQGGPLDFANSTIASLNAGSTTFSDGAALQELIIGNAGEAMVVNGGGTAPEWGTVSGAGSYVFLESFTAGAGSSTFTCTLASPIPIADFSRLVGVFNGKFGIGPHPALSGDLELQIADNLSTPLTVQYVSQNCVTSSAGVARVAGPATSFTLCNETSDAGAIIACVFDLSISTAGGDGSGNPSDMMCGWNSYGVTTVTTGGGKLYENTGNITTINGFYLFNSGAHVFEAGATLDIYKVVG